jgi:hypothetical protein
MGVLEDDFAHSAKSFSKSPITDGLGHDLKLKNPIYYFVSFVLPPVFSIPFQI